MQPIIRITDMKIAIPTMGDKGLEETVAGHFGRCPTYTMLDENGDIIEIIKNISSHMGGTGLPPELLQQNGVNILLCRGIGPSAIDLCTRLNIDTYVDSNTTVKTLYNNWKSNALSKASLDDSCEEHRR